MTSPRRHRLPPRRPSMTETIMGGGIRAHATVGYDPETDQPREVFLRPSGGGRVGSSVEVICDDAAVICSLALQHGISATYISQRLGRLPDGEPAGLVGAAIDLLAREERRRARTAAR